MPDPALDDPVLPAYGRASLAEVVPSVLAALGVPGQPAALPVPPARAVAVLLIDGLGAGLLRAHTADAPFLAGLPDLGPLTVGFPSSTAPSIASLGTGLPPGGHGIVGITFRTSHDEVLDALKWVRHGASEPVDLREEVPPEVVQPLPTMFERAAAAGVGVTVVSARAFRDSGLTRAALRGGRYRGVLALGDLAAEAIAGVAGPGPRLCYAYHADLDLLGHVRGPGSAAWRWQLTQADRLAATIASELPADAALLVTGDHGMVTVDRRFDADTDPVLQDGVALLGGDARARLVYARPGAAADVLATWRAHLGPHAWVVPGGQAVAEGWFGPVAPHAADRIGDVVAAARGTAAIVRSGAEPLISGLPGQHGSLTAAEQHVPLLLARP